MTVLKPYKTLAVGLIIGIFVWPMVKGKIPTPG